MGVMSVAGKGMEALTGQVSASHRFVVRIDSGRYDLGSWSSVSGLDVKWQQFAYKTGDAKTYLNLPGNILYSNIALSRAACSDSETVKEWLAETTKGRTLLSGAIHLVNFVGVPVVTWELKDLFPIGWSISSFDSSSSSPVIEKLELAHFGFLNDDVD
jgi:phage tail-like protein